MYLYILLFRNSVPMLRMRNLFLVVIFQAAGISVLNAQDLHFSQWFNEPL